MSRKYMKPVYVKKGSCKRMVEFENKKFELVLKTGLTEAIIATLEPGTELGKELKHHGEELHLVLEGIVEFEVDGESYVMESGDLLWHPSYLPHHAKNRGRKKVRYLTIGVPPTFL